MVKEAEALSEAGYRVHLIYTRHVRYLVDTDQQILESHPEWTYDHLDWAGAGIIPKIVKLISGLKRRAGRALLSNKFYNHQTSIIIEIRSNSTPFIPFSLPSQSLRFSKKTQLVMIITQHDANAQPSCYQGMDGPK